MSQVRRTRASTRRRTEPIALMVRPRSGLRVLAKAFWRICGANPDLCLERTSRGELIVTAPAGGATGKRTAGLTAQLWVWNHATGLGESFDSSAGFTLPNGAIRGPDAAWITKARWATLTPEQQRGFLPVCPDFVVELTSPSDMRRRPAVRRKMLEYIDQGARLAWLIDPDAREVEIYRPGKPVEVLPWPASLSGEDVLPGFVLDLRLI